MLSLLGTSRWSPCRGLLSNKCRFLDLASALSDHLVAVRWGGVCGDGKGRGSPICELCFASIPLFNPWRNYWVY